MSTAAHTPGPWVAFSHVVRSMGNGDADLICEYPQSEAYQSREYWPANANLISAAPELLAALKLCESFCKGHQETPEKRERYQQVRAAIAKAEGRS